LFSHLIVHCALFLFKLVFYGAQKPEAKPSARARARADAAECCDRETRMLLNSLIFLLLRWLKVWRFSWFKRTTSPGMGLAGSSAFPGARWAATVSVFVMKQAELGYCASWAPCCSCLAVCQVWWHQ